MPGAISSSARREISRRARDAFPPMGVYMIRNKESGLVLLASSRNVHGAINRAQFELRLGSHADKALQAQWHRSGPAAFEFEVLELVKERDDANFDYAEELQALEELYREHYAQAANAGR